MTSADPGQPATGRRYWRRRPGWRTGRDFYACYLTLEDQPELRGLVRRYQDAIGDRPGLDLIAPRWLHITMQGIGFADDIGPADLAAVTEGIGERLGALRPPAATFHRPTIRPAAVYLKADPAEPLYRLRLALHQAVASAVGPGQFDEPAPAPGRFAPHVSIAYADADDPVPPVAEAVRDMVAEAVTATFRTVSVLVLRRDRHAYGWSGATAVPIGARSG
jgi:2'-5' RNA ligase